MPVRGTGGTAGTHQATTVSDVFCVHDAKMGTHGSTPAAQVALSIEHESQTAHTGRQAPKVQVLSTAAALHNADW